MLRSAAVAAAALMLLAQEKPANAYSLTPTETKFEAKGFVVLACGSNSSSNCTMKLRGKIGSKGIGSVTSASFSGRTCPAITTSNLPWKIFATSANTAVIANVAMSILGNSCGPSNAPIGVTTNSFTFNGDELNGCAIVTGELYTSPTIAITNP